MIPHDGGPCPVPNDTAVEPAYRGPENIRHGGRRIICAPASRLDWSHDGSDDDIIGYIVRGFS